MNLFLPTTGSLFFLPIYFLTFFHSWRRSAVRRSVDWSDEGMGWDVGTVHMPQWQGLLGLGILSPSPSPSRKYYSTACTHMYILYPRSHHPTVTNHSAFTSWHGFRPSPLPFRRLGDDHDRRDS
jgi:hypothetical protein